MYLHQDVNVVSYHLRPNKVPVTVDDSVEDGVGAVTAEFIVQATVPQVKREIPLLAIYTEVSRWVRLVIVWGMVPSGRFDGAADERCLRGILPWYTISKSRPVK